MKSMLVTKLSYKCTKCGAKNVGEYPCENDSEVLSEVFDGGICIEARNQCKKCGHWDYFKLDFRVDKIIETSGEV